MSEGESFRLHDALENVDDEVDQHECMLPLVQLIEKVSRLHEPFLF
jgi:hypothetical protein